MWMEVYISMVVCVCVCVCVCVQQAGIVTLNALINTDIIAFVIMNSATQVMVHSQHRHYYMGK